MQAAGGAITAGTAYYMAVAERFAAIEQGEQALERSIVSLDAKVEAGQAELRRLLQPLAHELANETLENETARLKGEQQQLGVMLQQPMASALMHVRRQCNNGRNDWQAWVGIVCALPLG